MSSLFSTTSTQHIEDIEDWMGDICEHYRSIYDLLNPLFEMRIVYNISNASIFVIELRN